MEDGHATMPATEVVTVLQALEEIGCWVAIEGGWGVDALAGRQTRPHRDLDLDVDAAQERATLVVLEGLGYAIQTDWRPNRVELVAPGRGRVDVHPLTFDAEGNGIQAGLNGERYLYPAASFVTGQIDGWTVRCLSVEQQIEWHSGYELRASDHADLVVLHHLARDREGFGTWADRGLRQRNAPPRFARMSVSEAALRDTWLDGTTSPVL